MSDIYDDKRELSTLRGIVKHIRSDYQSSIGKFGREDIEGHRRRQMLAIDWPGDDIVMQIIKDTITVLIDNDINPRTLIKE